MDFIRWGTKKIVLLLFSFFRVLHLILSEPLFLNNTRRSPALARNISIFSVEEVKTKASLNPKRNN